MSNRSRCHRIHSVGSFCHRRWLDGHDPGRPWGWHAGWALQGATQPDVRGAVASVLHCPPSEPWTPHALLFNVRSIEESFFLKNVLFYFIFLVTFKNFSDVV